MPYCTNCGEKYNDNDKYCGKCGIEIIVVPNTVQDLEKPSHSVRKGMTNAKFNEEASNFLIWQISAISIFLGIYLSSWIIFGAVLVGLIIALQFKELALIICILLSIGAAVTGYFIGFLFESIPASIIIAILFFMSSLGYNLAGLQWANDLGD